MSLPLSPLKGTYKEFTSDVYIKETDQRLCLLPSTESNNRKQKKERIQIQPYDDTMKES